MEVKYQRGTVEAMDKLMPGGMGMEFGEALEYLNSPGYYGGEAAIRELNLITPDDVSTNLLMTTTTTPNLTHTLSLVLSSSPKSESI